MNYNTVADKDNQMPCGDRDWFYKHPSESHTYMQHTHTNITKFYQNTQSIGTPHTFVQFSAKYFNNERKDPCVNKIVKVILSNVKNNENIIQQHVFFRKYTKNCI